MRMLSRCSTKIWILLIAGAGSLAMLPAQDVVGTAPRSDAPVADVESGPVSASVSQVRIVRLSLVRGKVELERSNSLGFEPTFTNLPIVQGTRLHSLVGLAEVEFEDNSSLRIAPNTEIEFAELGRSGSGATTNAVKLQRGTLYVSLLKTKDTDFRVEVGGRTVTLTPSSHVRLDVYPASSELMVFHGKATVGEGASSMQVGPGKALKFGDSVEIAPVVAHDEEPGLYDEWDQKAANAHNAKVASGFAASPYAYGVSDLSYYGNFVNLGGCGQVWQPYFMGAGWDPYGSGMWAYYPGAGYSWVSPYPWGWMPFHSGNWVSCGGAGWGWQPGRNWNGLKNTFTLNPIHQPHPPKPPLAGQSGLVHVGMAALHPAGLTNAHTFEFAKDSAGLGVPREMPVNLRKTSQIVQTRGSLHSSLPSGEVLLGRAIGTAFRPATRPDAAGHSALNAAHLESRPVAVSARPSGAAVFSSAGRGSPSIFSGSTGMRASASSPASTGMSTSSTSGSGHR